MSLPPCECGAESAGWHGDPFGTREYACAACYYADHAERRYAICPADSPANDYAAGYDGNGFATADDARAEIPRIAEVFGTDAAHWVVVDRASGQVVERERREGGA